MNRYTYKAKRKKCEFCKLKDNEIYGKKFELRRTAGYDFESMVYNANIMKNKADKLAGVMITTYGTRGVFFDINYCPICGKKLNDEVKE